MSWTVERRDRFLARSSDPAFLAIDRWERTILATQASAANSIIDAGCGYGRFFGIWEQAGAQALAVDSDEVMCELARQHPSARDGKVSVENRRLPCDLPTADLAVCIRVLPSVTAAAAQTIVSHLCRIAGTVVLQVIEPDGSLEAQQIAAEGRHRFDDHRTYLAEDGRHLRSVHRAPTGPSRLLIIDAPGREGKDLR